MQLRSKFEAAQTKRLDHLGLIAAICFEIDLIGLVNKLVGATGRQVSVGHAVQAMVLNGLGFVGRPLYLAPEFFANKPIERLVGPGITADMLNDDSLGDALDRLYEAGLTEGFAFIAMPAIKHFGIRLDAGHLDSTSFSFHGDYPYDGSQDPCAVRLTHGYSKDKRPDLKQLVVHIITVHKSRIPMWFVPSSGNSSDKASFPDQVEWFCEHLGGADRPLLIVDSALYSAAALPGLDEVSRFITRVPATIKAVNELIDDSDIEQMAVCSQDARYHIRSVDSDYGKLDQRWVVVFSQPAHRMAVDKMKANTAKEREHSDKQVAALRRKRFENRDELTQAIAALEAKWRYHRVGDYDIERHEGFSRRGRPALGAVPDRITYQVSAVEVVVDEDKQAQAVARSGWFVLATNERDTDTLSDEDVLMQYKTQPGSVERGFRFLKSPDFFAAPMYLHSPRRIQAMLMVMTLCLLVYALAEHRLAQRQQETGEELEDARLPSGDNAKVTLRRVFQVFEGLDLLQLKLDHDLAHEQVLNLQNVHRRVLALFGPWAEKIYGLA